MTPRQFEATRAALWDEFEALLSRAEGGGRKRAGAPAFDAPRLAALYRASCEDLALAQARAYPIHLTERLQALTQRGHRLIYRRQSWGLGPLAELALVQFPQAVRAHGRYVVAATLLFALPLLAVAWASWRDPGFILHVVDAAQVQAFDIMYGPGAGGIGRERPADTDWQMFGFYIAHNIGIGFQCFASGILAGLGSVFFMVFNGVSLGAVSGYLVGRGYAENFLSFVVTHGAFELTAIVLAGAAGLRFGAALLAPGRLTRLQALRRAAAEAVVLVYGAIGMLLVAAAIEAFWSSARWVAPEVKYGVGAACWLLVLTYLGWQGRPARSGNAG